MRGVQEDSGVSLEGRDATEGGPVVSKIGPAFFDGHCPDCDHPVSWFGFEVDRPDCPNCGFNVPREKLDECQRMRERSNAERQARVAEAKRAGTCVRCALIGFRKCRACEQGTQQKAANPATPPA